MRWFKKQGGRVWPIAIGCFAVVFLLGIFGISIAQAQTTPAPAPAPAPAPVPATPTEPSFYVDPLGSVVYFLHSTVVAVFGWIMSMAGGIFDYAIQYFILEFGDLYINQGVGFIIEDLWSLVRDLFNLTLIFAVVITGLKLIWDANDSAAQRKLGYIIGAALLVNFSLFIVKFIIDFTNLLALQIHGAFVSVDGGSIGSEFLNIIQLSESMGSLPVNPDGTLGDPVGGLVMTFGLLILFLVAGFVFAAGAFLITLRYIALNLYMVFSPILFIGWVLPGYNNYSQKYWSGFFKRAFFAPAFIFMIYLSFQVIQHYTFEGRETGMSTILHPNASNTETAVATMAYFVLSIGFMISSLIVANMMGAHGSAMVISYGKAAQRRGINLLKGTGRAATYPARALARDVINQEGAKLERRFNRLQTREATSGMGRAATWLAQTRLADKAARGAAKGAKNTEFGTGTTDEKNQEAKKKHLAEINKRVDSARQIRNYGELSTLQNRTKEYDRIKSLQDKVARGEQLTPEEKESLNRLLSESSTSTLTTADRAIVKDLSKKEAAGTITAAEQAQLDALRNNAGAAQGLSAAEIARRDALATDEIKLRKAVTGLSVEQIEKLSADGVISNEDLAAIAPSLTQTQFEKINESKELSSEQKKAIGEARTEAVNAIVRANVNDVTKLTVEQLEMMGEAFIKENAEKGRLKQSQVDDLKKSKKFTEAQRNGFTDAYKAGKRIVVEQKLSGSNPVSINQLSTEELVTLGKDQLKVRAGELSKKQIDDLKKSKDFSPDDAREVESERTSLHNSGFKPEFFINKTDEFIAELPSSLLTKEDAAPFITEGVVRKIVKDGLLTSAERLRLRSNLANHNPQVLGVFNSPNIQNNW